MSKTIGGSEVAHIERTTSTIINTGYHDIDWLKEKRKLKQFYKGLESLLGEITGTLSLVEGDEQLERRLRVQADRVKSELKNVRRNL